MKSVNKINSALGQFDKLIDQLDKARVNGMKEKTKNTQKSMEISDVFDRVRVFADKVVAWFKDRCDKKKVKLMNSNQEINVAMARADRVGKKFKELLK